MTVGEVMEDDPVTIDADAVVEDAATVMHDSDISRLASGRCRSTPRRRHRSWRHPAVHGGRARRELTSLRPTVADIDLGAIRHNVTLLRRIASPAALCAVVKADGYGHGAIEAAVAALEAGATSLAVALVEEGDRSPRGRDHRPHPRALTNLRSTRWTSRSRATSSPPSTRGTASRKRCARCSGRRACRFGHST